MSYCRNFLLTSQCAPNAFLLPCRWSSHQRPALPGSAQSASAHCAPLELKGSLPSVVRILVRDLFNHHERETQYTQQVRVRYSTYHIPLLDVCSFLQQKFTARQVTCRFVVSVSLMVFSMRRNVFARLQERATYRFQQPTAMGGHRNDQLRLKGLPIFIVRAEKSLKL